MRGVRIEYGGVAVGAKENFTPTVNDAESFVDIEELKSNEIQYNNVVNPCDLYSVPLNGSGKALPNDPSTEHLGWWSKQVSDEDGIFNTPIVLTLTAGDLYSSSGISLIFDTFNNIYSNSLTVKWYREGELISEMDFHPNKSVFFCSNKVEFYNKIEVTFNSMNLPFNRLKVRGIEFGEQIIFFSNELRNIKIIQEIDPISSQIAINTCDFVLESKKDIEYSFQERQILSTYFDDRLISTTFIKSFKRKSRNTWSIQTEDYIGIMENIPYYGGIYENQNAKELLKDIFNKSNVPFFISDIFDGVEISGYIPYTNCREALLQVALAIGAIVDTSYSAMVNVYALNNDVSQTIPLNRILQGQEFESDTRLTAVEVYAHKYIPAVDALTVYESSQQGEGKNIFIAFNEPLHNLSISNGMILSSGSNYAIINAEENCVLTGRRYEHHTTIKCKSNPSILATDTENVVVVRNATLVSESNIDTVLQRCYNYYKNQDAIRLKIVEGKHKVVDDVLYGRLPYGSFTYGGTQGTVYDPITKVGDKLICETEYLEKLQGRVLRQEFNLNGGIVIKNTKIMQET